ncbi:MAG: endopeptidase La [candidate division Zixibacteria bacterium]|nr:endopeptidase La [candidate division Zixibacteria bacterium]
MIIKSKTRLPILASDKVDEFPVLPLRTGVLFPGTMLTIHVGRSESLNLIHHSLDAKREFVASYSPMQTAANNVPPIHQVGVLAVVRDSKAGPGESLLVTIEGIRRVSINEMTATEPFYMASVSYLQSSKAVDTSVKTKIDEVIEIVEEITHLDPTYSPEQLPILKMSQDDPSTLADRAASIFHLPLESKQELLETTVLKQRLEKLLFHLNLELDKAATIHNINESAKKATEEEQRKLFLRQQLHEIRKQLGEDFSEEKEVARIRKIIKHSSHLPPEVVSRALIEADRLSQLPTASAEFGVTKNYLDWVLALPWERTSPEDYEIHEVERILSTEYYGPTSLKEQILQRLSVRKLMGGVNEGPTLCLVGASGTGKAALAKAIAKALGKDFIRISVGGIAEVSEIKGTSRTFLGAMPGKIIRTLRDAGTCDPVILIEDIDYFNIDNDSSVNMALLEVIDIRKNSKFLDSYLGITFDLSKVFFVCSVRSLEEIPEQFIPRLEILEFPGYIEREKIVISKRYLIPNLLRKHGIAKSELRFSDKILGRIISHYTQESGLLAFSQQIEKICRKVALEKLEKGKTRFQITEKNIESYLGSAIFIPEKAETAPEIGTAAGLAWTGAGGDLMFIEGLKMKGDGQIITTGSLGDVMRESIQAAHSYVRSKADVLGIDFSDFNDFDIHIHFPSGAIPKDGPSAGVTVCLVVASIMSERPIRNDIAMTGEVTLRGRVLSVGGIKEKVSAAYRAGIYNVAIPKENEKDIRELPKEILRKTKFTYIERVDELFELCLLNFTPSSYTLEKIFAEEMEKAKKKKPRAKKTTGKAAKSKRRSGTTPKSK